MTRILDVFLQRRTGKSGILYPTPQDLYLGLQKEEAEAIRYLSSKVAGFIYKLGKKYALLNEDIEELQCDCITLLIEKIRDGKYEFRGANPATFVIEIAKNRVKNFSRTAQRHATDELNPVDDRAEESGFGNLEQVEKLQALLKKLNENCRKLIELKYLEEIKDKEVIERQLTQYTTVDALKNHRAQCMKKLIETGAVTDVSGKNDSNLAS